MLQEVSLQIFFQIQHLGQLAVILYQEKYILVPSLFLLLLWERKIQCIRESRFRLLLSTECRIGQRTLCVLVDVCPIMKEFGGLGEKCDRGCVIGYFVGVGFWFEERGKGFLGCPSLR